MDLTGFALTKVFEPMQPARKRRSDCLYLPSADGNEDVEIEVNCACLGFQKYNQNGIRFGPNVKNVPNFGNFVESGLSILIPKTVGPSTKNLRDLMPLTALVGGPGDTKGPHYKDSPDRVWVCHNRRGSPCMGADSPKGPVPP
jgi:hypothetical protein